MSWYSHKQVALSKLTLNSSSSPDQLSIAPQSALVIAQLYSCLLSDDRQTMARRPEFDLLYPNSSCGSTNNQGASRHSSKPETRAEEARSHFCCKESEEESDLLLLEAYVHRSRTEELEKRLNLQQSTHFTAAADFQAR